MTELARSRILRFTGEVVLPVEATRQQAEDWLRFVTGVNGSLASDNPLSDYDLEALPGLQVTDTGLHLHEKRRHDGPITQVATWRDREPAPAEPLIDRSHDDDATFLAYCEAHTMTPRRGFVACQLTRLCRLAGDEAEAVRWEGEKQDEIYSPSIEFVIDRVELARARRAASAPAA